MALLDSELAARNKIRPSGALREMYITGRCFNHSLSSSDVRFQLQKSKRKESSAGRHKQSSQFAMMSKPSCTAVDQPSHTSDLWSPSAPTPPLMDSSALPHSALAASKAVVSLRASLAEGPCSKIPTSSCGFHGGIRV